MTNLGWDVDNLINNRADMEPNQVSAAVDAYAQIRQGIIAGQFMPKERLLEARLAEMLHTGRATVRTALVRLEQEGLVELEPNRGARVRLVSDAEAIELMEARIALEKVTARYAAIRATPADKKKLEAVLQNMESCYKNKDFGNYSEGNKRLHQTIYDVSRHAVAGKLIEMVKAQSRRVNYRVILMPGRPENSIQEHRAIVMAIAKGDADAAELAVEAHLTEALRVLKIAIEQRLTN